MYVDVCVYVDFIKIFLNNKSKTICKGVGVMAAHLTVEHRERVAAQGDFIGALWVKNHL